MIKRALILISMLATMLYVAGANQLLFAAEVADNSVWIDVRTAREYREGHIEGAINIHHREIGRLIFEFIDSVFTEIHIYDGDSGTLAGPSLEVLVEMGFHDVFNEGSYENVLAKQAESAQ